MPHCTRTAIRTSLAAAGLGLALATVAQAADAPKAVVAPLGPGVVAGEVASYRVHGGEDVESIATHFAVNPVRVTGPNALALKGGLKRGEVVYVDLRRVRPSFAGNVSGIVLNVPEAQVYFVEAGQLVKSYAAGVSRTDWKVPIGPTKVVAMEKNPTWHVPKSIQAEMAKKGLEVKTHVDPGPKNPLGVRWIGFSDGTYGIHGTNEPGSIKRYSSHGCVHLLKGDLLDLYGRIKLGTPVHVDYQPVLLAVDAKAIWISVYPDIYERDYNYKAAVRHLANQAHVADRVDWKAVDRALEIKDGILSDVAVTSQPSATPASPQASR